MSQDSESSFKSLRQHEDYYLSGGDLFFLVGQYHFRVHRYFFERESKFFQGKLCGPAAPGSVRQGTSETTAIVLENVSADEFSKFLWVFYNPKYSLYDTSVEDWTTILDLAHRWVFPEVKSLVVRELEKIHNIPDVERIHIYQKYDVDRNLLIPCYANLCARTEPLTLDEGWKLGMETTLNLVRAREVARVAPATNGIRSPTAANLDPIEMHSMIVQQFSITEPPVVEPTSAAPPVNGTTTTTTNGEDKSSSGSTDPPKPPNKDDGHSRNGSDLLGLNLNLNPLNGDGKPDDTTGTPDRTATPDPLAGDKSGDPGTPSTPSGWNFKSGKGGKHKKG